jgi:hypothetical protein
MAKGYLKQYLLKKGTARGTPVSGTFELTARCNLSCKMCYIHAQADDMEKRSHELSAQKWLQLGRQAVDMGMIYLLLTGGEPMLRADFAEIYEGMAKMGVILSVNTNGTYLTQDLLDLFVKYPPEKINIRRQMFACLPRQTDHHPGTDLIPGGFQPFQRRHAVGIAASCRVDLSKNFRIGTFDPQ